MTLNPRPTRLRRNLRALLLALLILIPCAELNAPVVEGGRFEAEKPQTGANT